MNILSSFGNRPTIFLEIDKKYLKLSQSVTKGKSVLIERLVVEPVFGLSEEEISKVLADAVSLNSIIFDSVTVIIPRDRVITRYIKLPAVDRAEIERMVSFEISKQTPYSEEDIISDYKIVSTDEQGYSRIMLVLSPKAEITRINNVLGAFAARLKCVYFSSEAIAGWLNMPDLDLADGNYMCLVNIDTDRTEIAVISPTGLCFSRSISIGSDDLSDIQHEINPCKTRLLEEIKQSIALYLKEKDVETGDITKFVLTGASTACEDFLNFLKINIDIPSVFLNSLSGVRMSDHALSESGVPDNASVCVICGSPFVEAGINLLPQEQKRKNRKKRLVKKAAIITALSITMLSILLGAGIFKIHQRENTLKSLESIYSQINKTSSQIEEKLKKIRSIKAYLLEGESSLAVIYNLYELIPAGISLLDFDYDDISKSVRFSGRAGRMSDVFNLVSILESSEIFSNVQTRSVVQRQSREGAVVDFQIRCNFKIKTSA